MNIKFVPAPQLKEKVDVSTIGFGKYFTDYMFEMSYDEGQGWHDPQIVPYEPIAISPANAALHYGQSIFEGMKAYRRGDTVTIYRPLDHLNRLNNSAKLMDIPEFDVDFMYQALHQLIALEKDWIPTQKGQSLYIRPFIFATDAYLGVSAGHSFKFYIILSPVAAYYANGFAPVRIKVEDYYVRAVRGGLGEAKTAANYAASLHAGKVAHEEGFDQVLWLDGVHRKYIGEVGAMNILFKIDGTIVTPRLDGTILNGVTRRSVLAIAKAWGIPVEERDISIDELVEAHANGRLEEVFGSGTATVISPVGSLTYKGQEMVINEGKIGEFSQKVFNYLSDLQAGQIPDEFGFVDTVPTK